MASQSGPRSPFQDMFFPTDAIFGNTNIKRVPTAYNQNIGGDDQDEEATGDEEDCEVLYFTLPMECLVPCPSSLHETKGQHAGVSFQSNVISILMALVHMVEKKFYVEYAVPEDPGDAAGGGAGGAGGARRGRRGGGAAGDQLNVQEAMTNTTMEQTREYPKCRLLMEYLISENMVSVDDSFSDITLVDVVAVRFAFVCYGDAADVLEGFSRLFDFNFSPRGRKLAAERAKDKRMKSIPFCLRSHELVSSWTEYAIRARSYLGIRSSESLRDPFRNARPRPNSELYYRAVFSRAKSICVAERFMGGARVHPRQRQLSNHNFEFGIPGLVYEILPQWINRAAIMYCILPRAVRWREMPIEEQAETSNALEILADLESPAVRSLFAMSKQIQEKRNDLKDLCELVERRMQHIRRVEDVQRRTELTSMFRKDAMRQHQRVWNVSANISQVNKNAIVWSAQFSTWTTPERDRVMMDNRSLSTFGNMVAMDFYNLEFQVNVATTHSVFYMTLVCALNAYYYKLGTLHSNLMLLGAGASGKSFIMNEIDSILVPGSTNVVSNQTEKAMATGMDCNDHLTMFHEIPTRLLASDGNRNGSETGDTLFKDQLTRGTISTQTVVITDDHERIPVNYEAEHVGVVICASNEREDRMHESVKSRFICVSVNERNRRGAEVIDKQRKPLEVHGRYGSNEKRLAKDAFFHRIRMRQTMIIMVERLIATKVFDGPDLSIAHRVVNEACVYIKNNYVHGETFNVREVGNIVMFARTLTIMHACERYANDASSPGFGKSIEFANIARIQEYLVCTEEIAIFALSSFFPTLLRYNTLQTVELILRAVKNDLHVNPDTGELHTTDEDVYYYTLPKFKKRFRMYSYFMNAQKDRDVTTKLSLENIQVAFNQLTHMVAKDGRTVIILDDDEGVLKINCSYVREHFREDIRTGFYKLKSTQREIFEKVVYKALSHKFQFVSRNAILAFPFSDDAPFVMQTMDLGTRRSKRVILDRDLGFNIIEAMGHHAQQLSQSQSQSSSTNANQPMLKELYGGRAYVTGGVLMVACDLQDFVYTERMYHINAVQSQPQQQPQQHQQPRHLVDEDGEEIDELEASPQAIAAAARATTASTNSLPADGQDNRSLLSSRDNLCKVNIAPHTKVVLEHQPTYLPYPRGLERMYKVAFTKKVLKRVREDMLDGELDADEAARASHMRQFDDDRDDNDVGDDST